METLSPSLWPFPQIWTLRGWPELVLEMGLLGPLEGPDPLGLWVATEEGAQEVEDEPDDDPEDGLEGGRRALVPRVEIGPPLGADQDVTLRRELATKARSPMRSTRGLKKDALGEGRSAVFSAISAAVDQGKGQGLNADLLRLREPLHLLQWLLVHWDRK